MATLLSSVTADTTGTGASHSGPATVFVTGVFDGAFVDVQVSADDVTYVGIDSDYEGKNMGRFRSAGTVNVDARGTFYLRASLRNAGASTSISCVTT
jgi:hypothetical protein